MQRRARRDQPLSECEKRCNQRVASKRAKVSQASDTREQSSSAPIGQARADVAMTLMTTCYNIKRLAMFLHKGIDPFYKHATA